MYAIFFNNNHFIGLNIGLWMIAVEAEVMVQCMVFLSRSLYTMLRKDVKIVNITLKHG